MLFYWYQCN